MSLPGLAAGWWPLTPGVGGPAEPGALLVQMAMALVSLQEVELR